MSGRPTSEPLCIHPDVRCVNPYEFIRKYRCAACNEVMMCACDREFAEEFLPHQLDHGSDQDTGFDAPVTLGFQDGICRECRGLPAESYPKAELYGRSTKIVRYYWREIFFETTKRFAAWAQANDLDRSKARLEKREKHAEIEREVIEEFKHRHEVSPKYSYNEPSAAQVIEQYDVDVIDLRAEYVHDEAGSRSLVTETGTFPTPESVAAAHFRENGFMAMECESRPFHVLFGIFMWLLIQDPYDELNRLVGFGGRPAFEARAPAEQIWTSLPPDFGKPGYARRRAEAIEEHFRMLDDDLLWLFDYWLEPSSDLRQYLWAHRQDDVERARLLVETLAPDLTRLILRYLVDSYWARYTGWPDLFVFDGDTFLFAEVKGSGDKLSIDQKRWIADNATMLHLPFKLVKVHRDRGRHG